MSVILACGLALLTCPAPAGEDLGALEEQAVQQAVATVASAVVRIETIGGLERVEGMLMGEGPTTGLIVSSDGFIISSEFNFIRQPTSILVTLPKGERLPAQIVARDRSRALVLFKVAASQPLAVAAAVPLAEMSVGQWTIAVGRTHDPQRPNVSVGILSAKSRIWGKAIQTDAKISPANYGGPLIDIRGRVLGVLVPMSPDSQDEVAGAEWYDSGIGFAVPLAEINRRLPRLQRREDVLPGLLGITLKGQDIYSAPADVAAVQVKSPAYQAGLRAGDRIVELDGAPIELQRELKHALGNRDAGDKVRLVAVRGSERLTLSAELAAKLLPYEHPFLGILPARDAPPQQTGVAIRYVYPGSGAAAAGIRAGDRIIALEKQPVATADSLRVAVASHEPGQKVLLRFQRDQQQNQAEVQLSSLPAEIPASLPPPRATSPDAAKPAADTGLVEIKIPEEPNACVALIPRNYDPKAACGVVVLLPMPGEFKKDTFASQWRAPGEQNGLIVLAPQSQQPKAWQPTDADFVRKTLDHVVSRYAVDRTRVVVYGYQASGAMAFLFAFRNRELVRGAAVVDAAIPRRLRLPDNDPVERLAVYLALPAQSKAADDAKAGAERLRELKYPVTVKPIAGASRQLNDDELAELLRWVDTLDRI